MEPECLCRRLRRVVDFMILILYHKFKKKNDTTICDLEK